MTYLVVLGEAPHYITVYEADSEEQVLLLREACSNVVVYEKPHWWDELPAKFWDAYSWARGGIGSSMARADLLSRVATRVD